LKIETETFPYPNNKMKIPSRIEGALLGLACGDALGAPAEFKTQADVKARFGVLRDMVGGGPWQPGEWTDDTAMALGIARGIIENPVDPVPIAGTDFLHWSKNAKDVGSTIRAALNNFSGDWPVAARSTPQAQNGHAAGNGSLMRTLPVALAYSDESEMLKQSARLSSMTHWDAQAEVCCAIYNLWISHLLAGQSRHNAWRQALAARSSIERNGKLTPDSIGPAPLPPEFWPRLEAIETLEYSQLQPSGYAGYCVECLEAAVNCVLRVDSLEACLIEIVNLAGEADTMAAVAGGAAGAFWGVEKIPARWLEKLHQREELENIARELGAVRRHYKTYATPGLPAFEYSQISDNIFAGRNPLTARDIREMQNLGITRILDLREPHEWGAPKFGAAALETLEKQGAENPIHRTHLLVPDMGAPSPETFSAACKLIDETEKNGGKIYIHCRAGMERTAAILIAYHAKTHGVSYEESLATLRRARTILKPLPNQEIATRAWLEK
jgi:ADP-ribosyl-[dinitrogen reductase] hydrolase